MNPRGCNNILEVSQHSRNPTVADLAQRKPQPLFNEIGVLLQAQLIAKLVEVNRIEDVGARARRRRRPLQVKR